ncbi:hypothetical protein [Flexithrix dorotheae]|uniref:hypothetical protein n=1 Tax=Flexithrix dorotheae TaxID=70993 RepID=UPI00037DA88D|nr:hypothetical protein [Flexithrix dorotheae]
MKLVQIKLILLFLLLSTQISYTQVSKAYRFAFNPTGESTSATDFWDPEVNMLDGSPYYSESNEWKEGLIYLGEKEELPEYVLLRYNLMTDFLEIKYEQDSFIVDNTKIHKFKIKDEQGEYSLFFQNGFSSTNYSIEEKNYFEILYTGKSKLVVDYIAKVKVADASFGATRAMAANGQTPRDKIAHEEEFYLYKPDGKLHRLSLKKKEFLKEMGEHDEKVAAFMKKNKLRTTKQDQLVKIISYYDSL